ncbi:MAG: trigger factor [Xenococcaceae cyanobacterium]
MKVTQEKLPASQIGLEIEISAETSQSTYERVVQDLARTSNIPGFRKGKVPRQVLLQRFGSQRIKATALEEMIQKSLEGAIKQESIPSLGNYQLRSNFEELLQSYQPGKPVIFSAAVDVPPEAQLGEYQGLEVRAIESVYDPADVDKFLEERRAEKADLVPVEDRPAQMGDVAIVDFQGKLTDDNGEETEEIEGGQATNFQVEVEIGRLIPGMVEGIVGMKPEETKKVAVTFPEDYPKEELAGKPAVFSITLKELKQKELPDLDDDFAQDASEEFETIAQWRESLEKQLQEKASKETKNSIHEALLAKLHEQSTVELPESMIQDEVTNVLTQTLMQMQQMGIDVKRLFTPESVPKMRENSRPEAIERLQKSLILTEVAKRESIQPDSTAIEDKIKEVSAQLSGQDIDTVKLRQMVEEDLLKEKTLDWLQEKAKVELVPKGTLNETEDEEEAESVDDSEE